MLNEPKCVWHIWHSLAILHQLKNHHKSTRKISMKDYSKMTDEELEDEALDLAGEAWEIVKRGYGKNLPKTFEEMVESMREYLRDKQKEALKSLATS